MRLERILFTPEYLNQANGTGFAVINLLFDWHLMTKPLQLLLNTYKSWTIAGSRLFDVIQRGLLLIT